jgi:hypothetical protein
MDIQKQKAFAQDLAALMRKHDAYGLDVRFRITSPDDGPFEEARFTYNRGRHGTAGNINLIVTTHIGDFKEELPDERQG